MELNYNSVETIPNLNASAAFKVDSGKVFKEDVDIVPVIIDKTLSYVPWGGDNEMPYDILKLIEGDETLATCQMFNAKGTKDCVQTAETYRVKGRLNKTRLLLL